MGAAINPIVQGLMNAYNVNSLIRRQALAEREMKLREERANQDRVMQDVKMAIRLPQISRPVNNGMVDATTRLDLNENAPASLHQAQAVGILPDSIVAPRKANAGRTVKWGEREYELLDPIELATIEAEKQRLVQGGKNQAALQFLMQKMAMGESPGVIATANRNAANQRNAARITSRETIAGENRNAANTRAANAITSRETIAREGNTTRRDIAGMIEGGRNRRAGQAEAGRDRRANLLARTNIHGQRYDRFSRDIAQIDGEIQALDAEAVKHGDASRLEDGAEFLDARGQTQRMNPLYRARFSQMAREAKAKADLKRSERTRLAGEIGWGSLSPEGQSLFEEYMK